MTEHSESKATLQPCNPDCAWRHPALRFVDDRDCLAAFLALEAAEVLAGVKPANLVRLQNKNQPCGRNLQKLWQRYGIELIGISPLTVAILRESDSGVLMLLYRSTTLEKRLAGRSARTFLQRAGYPKFLAVEQTLSHLAGSFAQEGIPHEIGVFLGYPLKDVAAFMGWTRLPIACQRLWKIFGKPHRSLRLAAIYRAKKEQMLARLAGTSHPLSLLKTAAD